MWSLFSLNIFERALNAISNDWRKTSNQHSPKQDRMTALVGYFCIDSPQGPLLGPMWSLASQNGGRAILPNVNHYNQPGLLEHTQDFKNQLPKPNGAFHAETNALGALIDSEILKPGSTGWVYMLVENSTGYICDVCAKSNLPWIASFSPGVNFKINARMYGKALMDGNFVHPYNQARRSQNGKWSFRDKRGQLIEEGPY